jgi:hypothetical protein
VEALGENALMWTLKELAIGPFLGRPTFGVGISYILGCTTR